MLADSCWDKNKPSNLFPYTSQHCLLIVYGLSSIHTLYHLVLTTTLRGKHCQQAILQIGKRVQSLSDCSQLIEQMVEHKFKPSSSLTPHCQHSVILLSLFLVEVFKGLQAHISDCVKPRIKKGLFSYLAFSYQLIERCVYMYVHTHIHTLLLIQVSWIIINEILEKN